MQKDEFSAGKPEAIAGLPENLRDMGIWSSENPPREGWGNKADAKVVHLHPHVKFTIQAEIAKDMAYGLDRDDALAELGVFGAELDSQKFAQSLLESIQDHLSIRNLKHLSDVFAKELAEEEVRRARYAQGDQTVVATGSGD